MPRQPNVIQFPLPRQLAEQEIRRLANEGKFVIEPHFREVLLERDFTMRQVLETLKLGCINQGPTLDTYGDWRCRLKRRVAGRLVRIVVALKPDFTDLYLVSVH